MTAHVHSRKLRIYLFTLNFLTHDTSVFNFSTLHEVLRRRVTKEWGRLGWKTPVLHLHASGFGKMVANRLLSSRGLRVYRDDGYTSYLRDALLTRLGTDPEKVA